MTTYSVRFVHKISPRDTDTAAVDLPDGAFSDRNTLGKALRAANVLSSGHRVRTFRVEGDRVIAFPSGSCNVWHSIILQAQPNPPIPGWGLHYIPTEYHARHLCTQCGCAYEMHLGGQTCPPTEGWGRKLPDIKFSDDTSPEGVRADLARAADWWRKSGTVFKPVV